MPLRSILSFLSLASLLIAGNSFAAEGHHWRYIGQGGPAEWGKLSPDNKACSMGKRQSPIDINDGNKKENKSLPQLMFSYIAAPLKILNNGHTIQMNYPQGSKVTIGPSTYDLLQFHFHTPSEHAFNGKRTELEVHFVNKGTDGSLAVVGILMKKGKKNSELESLFNKMPSQAGKEDAIENSTINPNALLPKDKDYYTYQGSLTTPPCSEIVTWYVIKDKIEVSEEQIKKFQKLFPMNARPLQSISSRIVEEKD
ncbi:carbonic anhydrase [Pigmentibacter ruber]|uniref:carbonic anhydrase n=1 Tax=Pigmentibacter ruber TaxID=2683196 RepID=UPI00131B72BC|nr:carbonic anhydrase family protein [Pigmentibacter ruber]BFD32803.1 carbonic anhydrase family protein [Pigmentibacter ruber]